MFTVCFAQIEEYNCSPCLFDIKSVSMLDETVVVDQKNVTHYLKIINITGGTVNYFADQFNSNISFTNSL